MALVGAGRGLGDVAAVTLIQARAPYEVRSRVFAAQDGAAHAAFSVSAFTGGLLVQLAGPHGAFATAAASHSMQPSWPVAHPAESLVAAGRQRRELEASRHRG